jgi:glycosyltransferase involved in cell wall biosynthesis
MLLSVIIPAHNEEKVIGKCLKAIMIQSCKKNFEVIVINDGSTDKTEDIVKKYPVKLIRFNQRHSAAFARNVGAKKAKGKFIVFIDADQIAEKKFIEKIINFIKKENFDGSDYLNFSFKPKTIFQKAWSAFRKFYPSVGFPHIIKRKVFKKLHGFNEKIFYYEDDDLKERFVKAGYNFKGPINAKVYHIEPENWSDFVRQRKWQAKGILSVLKERKRIIILKYFVPILLLPLCYFSFIPLLIYFVYFWLRYSIKTKEVVNSFLWVVLDYIGRFISLFYLIKLKLDRYEPL